MVPNELQLGHVFTFLHHKIEAILSALNTGNTKNIDSAIADLMKEDFYRDDLNFFKAPVNNCPKQKAIEATLDKLKEKSKNLDYKTTIENIDSKFKKIFSDNAEEQWGVYSYFIIPVMHNSTQAGMVYLRANEDNEKGHILQPNPNIRVIGLTKDQELSDHFNSLAKLLEESLYQVTSLPPHAIGISPLLKYYFTTLFGTGITEGRSMSAAVFAIFATTYLREKLGALSYHLASPKPGTVITGDIDLETGRILTVKYLKEKIEGVVQEYGKDLKIIYPADINVSLSADLVKKGNLCPVNTVEELMTHLFYSESNRDAFYQARNALYKLLSQQGIENLLKRLKPGLNPSIYYKTASALKPDKFDYNIHVLGRQWRDELELRFGFEESAVQDESDENKMVNSIIVIVLDGSILMEPHWVKDNGSVCQMAGILNHIARQVPDLNTKELWFGFLSSSQFHRIKQADASLVEKLLLEKRAEYNLAQKPPFFQPVLKGLNADFSNRAKELYIFSDAYIPDLNDVETTHATVTKSYRLRYGVLGTDTILCDEDNKLITERLDKRFQEISREFKEISINFGNELPLWWDEGGKLLKTEEENYILRYQRILDKKFKAKVKMAYNAPKGVNIEGILIKDKDEIGFSFPLTIKSAIIKPLTTPEQGNLAQDEFELWQEIRSSGNFEQLRKSSDITVEINPNFKSLSHFSMGYLVLRASDPGWHFFTKGCQIDGIMFVEVGSRIQVFDNQRDGVVVSKTNLHYLYTFSGPNEQYYILRIYK